MAGERVPPAGRLFPKTGRRGVAVAGAALSVLVLAGLLAANLWGRAFRSAESTRPTFAVGMIREDGVPDTLRIGGVLTDMLATNLARIGDLSVLANSRLFELMLPGQDTLVTGYLEAARRAGATEILQGRLLAGPEWTLALEIQRVDLATGIVKGGYRVSAGDRYALVDSMTAAIARDLHLGSPAGSVAEATTDSPIAYRLYEEGLRAFYQYDVAGARRLFQAALREDSTFAMAAYYDARSAAQQSDERPARRRALRLAARAPERERLTITADILIGENEPTAGAVAESLATKYPNDPRAQEMLSRSLHMRGDWRGAIVAVERAIALDSASEPLERENCSLCGDLGLLTEIYLWWDSLPAAERAAHRFLRLRPRAHGPWHTLTRIAAARGDTAALRSSLRRLDEMHPIAPLPALYRLRASVLVEDYRETEREVQALLESRRGWDPVEARWLWSIALRNEGRIEDALRLSRIEPAPNYLSEALLELERGNARKAVSIFRANARHDQSMYSLGTQARNKAWSHTLLGMALAAAGDTVALKQVTDTVEYWGERSGFERDRRAHHYMRGLLLLARGRDAEAADELRAAIHSPTHGFTRTNYELGRTLLRLNRPAEAVPVVRAALHGDVDGSNLYMTRTDLHELLAQAFDRLGARDSAAVHYRAVVRAWEKADTIYHARRARARDWLASFDKATPQ